MPDHQTAFYITSTPVQPEPVVSYAPSREAFRPPLGTVWGNGITIAGNPCALRTINVIEKKPESK